MASALHSLTQEVQPQQSLGSLMYALPSASALIRFPGQTSMQRLHFTHLLLLIAMLTGYLLSDQNPVSVSDHGTEF